MEVKMIAFFVIFALNVGWAVHAESDIIGIVVDDQPESVIKRNGTAPDDDWSKVVSELAIALEKIENEKSSENEDEMNIPGKSRIIKRQIIKIPSSVTKVKVIAPNPIPQARPKRMPPTGRVPPYGNHQRKRPPRRHNHKRPVNDVEEDYDEPYYRSRDVEGRRGKNPKKSKLVVKEVSPEEFYEPDDYHQVPGVESYQKQTRKSHGRKTQKQIVYGSEDSNEVPPQRRARRPSDDAGYVSHIADGDAEYSMTVRSHYEKRPYSEQGHEYAASSIHMKQVPAPNLTGLNLIEAPDMLKEAKPSSVRTGKESAVADYTAKSAPSPLHSTYPQQYTSHNPQVVTNFGLDDGESKTSYSLPKNYEDTTAGNFGGGSLKYNQVAAKSEHHVTAIPARGSGLKVVEPPQLGSNQNFPAVQVTTETPRGNQRATIRDILQQDCPDYEMLGFCSSPPRYPTIQIANMANKCSELQDIMNSPIPPEPQDDLTSFAKRLDDDLDIVFESDTNGTQSENSPEVWSSWSRSSSASETACASEYTIIEPGYAREVTSGRWFVIVQNSDSSLQKVTIDTCLSAGKPCDGLAGLKCSRTRGFHNGIKSTRCIQRYTHQRLISWDPESPNKCPRIRVFRFPTACVCHLKSV